MRPKLLKPGFLDLLGVLILSLLVFLRGSLAGDPGLGWHLKTGHLLLATKTFLFEDPFLFTEEPRSWVVNQWLGDVLFASLAPGENFSLLHLFGIGLLFIAFIFIPGRFLMRETNSSLLAASVVFLIAGASSTQWFLRPVLFSFVFFAGLLNLLFRVDGKASLSKDFFLLPLLFCLWANIHPGFTLGLLLFALFILSAVLEREPYKKLKELLLVFLLSIGGTLLNPVGAALYTSAGALLGDSFFMSLHMEWFPPELLHREFVPFYLFLGILVGALALTKKLPWTTFDVILVCFFLVLAFSSRRYIPFFSLAASLPLAKLLGEVLKSSVLLRLEGSRTFYSAFFLSGIFLFTIFAGHLPTKTARDSFFWESFPHGAAAYLQNIEEDTRVFHTPNWGGFLIWHLFPKHQVFIDDRNVLNGEARYRDFLAAHRAVPEWKDVFQKYKFNRALLEPGAPLAAVLGESSNWELEFSSPRSVLFRQKS